MSTTAAAGESISFLSLSSLKACHISLAVAVGDCSRRRLVLPGACKWVFGDVICLSPTHPEDSDFTANAGNVICVISKEVAGLFAKQPLCLMGHGGGGHTKVSPWDLLERHWVKVKNRISSILFCPHSGTC